MKRKTAWLLALVLAVSLCACGQEESAEPESAQPEVIEPSADEMLEADDAQTLTLEELKAIIAVNQVVLPYLDGVLDDPESLSILEIDVVSVPGEPQGYHMVRVDYNAANSTGGRDRDELYVETSRGGTGDNSEYLGDTATQTIRRGNNRDRYDECVAEGVEEVSVDVDTVMRNLELSEDELYDMVWAQFDAMGIR